MLLHDLWNFNMSVHNLDLWDHYLLDLFLVCGNLDNLLLHFTLDHLFLLHNMSHLWLDIHLMHASSHVDWGCHFGDA